MRARRNQLDRLLDQRGEVEGDRHDVEATGLDLGEIENLVDQRQQQIARCLDRPGIGRLLRRERGVEQEI